MNLNLDLTSRRSTLRRIIGALIALVAITRLTGCIGDPANPAATQPATAIDVATTQPSYWYRQPGPSMRGKDFDVLWNACEQTAHDYGFAIDRSDYRMGVLTTIPLTSRQWFEFWRPDVRSWSDLERTALTNTRRTLRFDFTRQPDGSYIVSPKALVERQVIAEQRITSVVNYRGVFQRAIKTRDQPSGTAESDEGVDIPQRYWYPIGRDSELERVLTDSIREYLNRAVPSQDARSQ